MKIILASPLLLTAAACSEVPCLPPGGELGQAAQTAEAARAIRLGDEHLRRDQPAFHAARDRLRVRAYDEGDGVWILSYRPPPDTAGGGALMVVSPELDLVLSAQYSQ